MSKPYECEDFCDACGEEALVREVDTADLMGDVMHGYALACADCKDDDAIQNRAEKNNESAHDRGY